MPDLRKSPAREIVEVLGRAASVARGSARELTGRADPDLWWHIGFHSDPTDFVPWELCSWENRFDDPDRGFRTLYCGALRVTCVREVLADLRPNVTARAELAQFQLQQLGIPAENLFEPSRRVTARWRSEHVLVRVRVHREGKLPDLDEVSLREALERDLASELREHGMDHLDISEVRSKNRAVSQAVARELHRSGAAGARFRSNLDDQPCVAVFEGRAWLEGVEDEIPLDDDVDELLQVCSEYGLILEAA